MMLIEIMNFKLNSHYKVILFYFILIKYVIPHRFLRIKENYINLDNYRISSLSISIIFIESKILSNY